MHLYIAFCYAPHPQIVGQTLSSNILENIGYWDIVVYYDYAGVR